MAYNNFSNPRQQFQRSSNPPQPPAEIKPLPLPEDYVDAAEDVMRKLASGTNRKITTSKIRNLLSLVTDIYNTENLRDDPELLPGSKSALTMMRIRVVYEAGREATVKEFVEAAKLLQYIKGIGNSREKLIDFAHYMEALVAYHRYLIGGKEG